MIFEIPEVFGWYHNWKQQRHERKLQWRKRFALIPRPLTNSSGCEIGKWIWLERYMIIGEYHKVPLTFHKDGGLFGGPSTTGGWSYWVWHRKQI